jgi:hypothetical protein
VRWWSSFDIMAVEIRPAMKPEPVHAWQPLAPIGYHRALTRYLP